MLSGNLDVFGAYRTVVNTQSPAQFVTQFIDQISCIK